MKQIATFTDRDDAILAAKLWAAKNTTMRYVVDFDGPFYCTFTMIQLGIHELIPRRSGTGRTEADLVFDSRSATLVVPGEVVAILERAREHAGDLDDSTFDPADVVVFSYLVEVARAYRWLMSNRFKSHHSATIDMQGLIENLEADDLRGVAHDG